jgi:multidrug efflux pump subunit AcrA (membrane-fusion protein)
MRTAPMYLYRAWLRHNLQDDKGVMEEYDQALLLDPQNLGAMLDGGHGTVEIGTPDPAGTLDFVDNALDRSSGTIHARATVANPNLVLTPGLFARVRLVVAPPSPTLLVPDAAVLPDQSEHMVMTVSADGKVAPKRVEIGEIRGGLRVIRSGLAPSDRVIVDGLLHAAPGTKVATRDGTIRSADGQD